MQNLNLQNTMDTQDTIVRTGAHRFIGKITIIKTDRGDIEFRGEGPTVAQSIATGELVCLSDWPGKLPDLRALTAVPCPDCATTCDECTKGARACMTCGGSGKKMNRQKDCPACLAKTGRFSPTCKTCRGAGTVVDPVDCAECKGKGTISCTNCAGTGKMSTGNMGGSKKWQDPDCAGCAGQKRKSEIKRQDLQTFLQGQLQGMAALGPIRRLVIHTGGEKLMTMIDVSPDESGNLMVLLLRSPQAGSRMYFIGGRMQIAA